MCLENCMIIILMENLSWPLAFCFFLRSNLLHIQLRAWKSWLCRPIPKPEAKIQKIRLMMKTRPFKPILSPSTNSLISKKMNSLKSISTSRFQKPLNGRGKRELHRQVIRLLWQMFWYEKSRIVRFLLGLLNHQGRRMQCQYWEITVAGSIGIRPYRLLRWI